MKLTKVSRRRTSIDANVESMRCKMRDGTRTIWKPENPLQIPKYYQTLDPSALNFVPRNCTSSTDLLDPHADVFFPTFTPGMSLNPCTKIFVPQQSA